MLDVVVDKLMDIVISTSSVIFLFRPDEQKFPFSDKGIVYSARAYKIPECTRAAAGTPLVQVPTIYFVLCYIFCFVFCSDCLRLL